MWVFFFCAPEADETETCLLADCNWQTSSLKSWRTEPLTIWDHCSWFQTQLDTCREYLPLDRNGIGVPATSPTTCHSEILSVFLKALWNVEQILSALSAWTSSPLAGLKSKGPVRELTEFHMEARNRGTSCLSPALTLISRCLVNSLPSCLSMCVCVCVRAQNMFSCLCVFFTSRALS